MKIALLAQGVIAKKCLKIFKDCPLEEISISVVVTTDSFYQNEILDNFGKVKFIDNSVRNEDLILSAISDYDIDTIISIQHPWILSSKIIDAVDKRAFNLHNAKLPDYKGHNSISHAILNADEFYTTTIHRLSQRVDMGDIIFEDSIPIKPNDTAYSLYKRTLLPARKIFRRLVEHLSLGFDLPSKKIEMQGKFYSKNGLNTLKEISMEESWDDIQRKVRAFYFPPHEPAFIRLGNNKVYPHVDLKSFY